MPLILDGTNGINASTGSLNLQTGGSTGLSINTSQNVSFNNPLAGSTGASLVLIQSQNAAGATSVDFTSGIDSTYDEYIFVISGLVPATSDDRVFVRVSEDSGSTWKSGATDYEYSATVAYSVATGNFTNATTGDTKFLPAQWGISSTAANGGMAGEMRLYTPSNTTRKKLMKFNGLAIRDSSSLFGDTTSSCRYKNSNNAINGVRFLAETTTWSTGTITLYGVKKS